jgi:hypothetical protein
MILEWKRGGVVVFRSSVGAAEAHDGAKLIGFQLSHPRLADRLDDVRIEGKATIYVAFEDLPGKDTTRIDSRLEEILDFIKQTVVPALEPFVSETS